MSSSRLFFNSLKYAAIPGVNGGIAYVGYLQYQRNQELFNKLPSDKQRLFQQQYANAEKSADVIGILSERSMNKITHSKD